MNDPVGRDEFNELVEHVKRIEQATEPIELKIVRGLPVPEATLLQKIMTQVGQQSADIGVMKGDISTIKTRLDGIDGTLKTILERLPSKQD
jgi:hypothetical protein